MSKETQPDQLTDIARMMRQHGMDAAMRAMGQAIAHIESSCAEARRELSLDGTTVADVMSVIVRGHGAAMSCLLSAMAHERGTMEVALIEAREKGRSETRFTPAPGAVLKNGNVRLIDEAHRERHLCNGAQPVYLKLEGA